MADKYSRLMYEMDGSRTFHVNAGDVAPSIASGERKSFTKCSVVAIEQDGRRKPHYAVLDVKGARILEVSPQSSYAYTALAFLVGLPLKSVRFTASEFHNDTSFEVKLKTDMSALSVGKEPIKRIVLDTETTGLDPEVDEILQLSIIDGDGNILLNNYYKPENVTYWPEAEQIHHISSWKVRKKPPITSDLAVIQDILNRAEEVVIYNAPFDLAFLSQLGMLLDLDKVTDTMREYGQRFHGKNYYKLQNAAKESMILYTPHDALADCKATLAVQKRVDSLIQRAQEREERKAALRARITEQTDILKTYVIEQAADASEKLKEAQDAQRARMVEQKKLEQERKREQIAQKEAEREAKLAEKREQKAKEAERKAAEKAAAKSLKVAEKAAKAEERQARKDEQKAKQKQQASPVYVMTPVSRQKVPEYVAPNTLKELWNLIKRISGRA